MAAKKQVARPPAKRVAKPAGKSMKKSQRERAAAPSKRRATEPESASSQLNVARADPAVGAYLSALDHPLKAELEELRRLILDASPEICEGIKWNAPSFRAADWFASINVHGGGRPPRPADPPALRLILHTGAKVKESAIKGLKIADPAGLLKWLAKDRCLVTFADGNDVRDRKAALQAIVREWIRQL